MTARHDFAGFGPAPYRIVKLTEKVHVIPGVSVRAGGSCDACGQSIRWAYTVRAADGTEFDVGCDCAVKAGMSAEEIREARRARRAELWAQLTGRTRADREAAEREKNRREIGYALTNREVNEAQSQGVNAARQWLENWRIYRAEYLGEPKQKIELEVIVKSSFSFETLYGPKTIWIFRTREGDELKWASGASLGLEDKKSGTFEPIVKYERYSRESWARWFKIRATVKDLTEYKGMRQTEIVRPKVVAITSDWIEKS